METGVACLLAHVASIIAADGFDMSAVTPANISSFADRTFSFLARASGHGLHRYLQSVLKSFAAPSIVDIAITEATCDAGFGQLLRAAVADLPSPRSVEVRCAWCRPVLVCGLCLLELLTMRGRVQGAGRGVQPLSTHPPPSWGSKLFHIFDASNAGAA